VEINKKEISYNFSKEEVQILVAFIDFFYDEWVENINFESKCRVVKNIKRKLEEKII